MSARSYGCEGGSGVCTARRKSWKRADGRQATVQSGCGAGGTGRQDGEVAGSGEWAAVSGSALASRVTPDPCTVDTT